MDVTVLKLELPDAQFNAPFTGRSTGDRGEDVPGGFPDEAEDDSGGGMSGLVALGVLIALAALAWYLRSGSGQEMEPHPEDVTPEGHA